MSDIDLQVIALALEDAIAYREVENNRCLTCAEMGRLCADHDADQDRAGDYRAMLRRVEITPTAEERCLRVVAGGYFRRPHGQGRQ